MQPFLLDNNLHKRKYAHKKIDKDFKHTILRRFGTNYQIETKKKIIIFTTQMDAEIDEMGAYFLANNIDYDRINSEDIADQYFSFNIDYNQDDIILELTDKRDHLKYILNNYDLIWFRHFSAYLNIDSHTPDYEVAYYNQEWDALLSSIPQLFQNKVIIPSWSDGFLTKPYQLKLAQKCGLKILPTVISNSFNDIKRFSGKDNISKAICHHMFFTGGNNLVEFNTKNFGKLNSTDEEAISKVPAIYQPNMLKDKNAYEVRVTVFGPRMVAYKYQNYFGKDWHSQLKNLKVKEISLPSNLKNSIQAFFHEAKIVFGTVDFIVSQNNWYFLETNVNGDWGWLENLANTSFSNLLIKTLLEL